MFLNNAADVVINPFRQDLAVPAVFDRTDLPGEDEKLGLGEPIAEYLRGLGGRIPLRVMAVLIVIMFSFL